ncbi:surface lipoprotein assembly modifier [Rhodosalinus sediminis]|uniref:surface lipoprotein assembly modifier n=1 Tax=Rhodosalinus sediminis TaxID=1940533 RepID=UPI00235755BE|nr:surface lipoprotein assembly modifier [Rhodosalinus sediminis]
MLRLSLAALFVCFHLLHPAAAADPARGASVDAEAWARGIAAVRAGAPEAAVPHLERAVSSAPDHAGLRLDLGVAHFLADNDRKARFHIDAALSGRLSDDAERLARRLLARLDRRRVWRTRLRFAIVPQSNAAQRSDLREIRIGTLVLTPNEADEPGTALSYGLSVTYTPRFEDGWRGRLRLGLSGEVYENDDWNETSAALEAGLTRKRGDRRIGGGVLAREHYLAGERFSYDRGLYATYRDRLSRRTRVAARVEAGAREAPDRPARDAGFGSVSVTLRHAPSPRWLLSGGVSASRIDARSEAESRRIAGLTLGVTRAFDGGWVASLDARLSRERRDGPAPVFGERRDETTRALGLRLLNRDLTWRGATPVLKLEYEERAANIAYFGYDNTSVSVGLTRSF